ncbi:PLP-dependent aminotransferase family protein [Amycolatopsis suaedae]|uniref:PLP-dependent aminotransferase family protein n=1 Tax=Amycolatopsis suaedae TaxID=2510978 RepID=A0A4Q7IZN3_9PSEU|nr:PLP-dependent aminotransferase family protein [Amycolatopsis suaedae]RZQ59566.1 PLP-dependent aminotransferase family protein [Amycolatopsis suaedae]
MQRSWSSSRDLHLGWDPGTGRAGLAEALRSAIRGGRLPEGAALPSTRALAADFGVARGTVAAAYDQLAAEGYLRTRQGAPTRVAMTAGLQMSAPAVVPEAAARWNLLPCQPDVSSFPRQAWLTTAKTVLQTAPPQVFGYPEYGGLAPLRDALARYLARSRGVVADPERVVVCGGFSHAIALLATVLHTRGDRELAFEDPSLAKFRDIAAAAGQRIVGVPVDDDGIRVSAVDSSAVVVTAAHQYPMGVTLSSGRRTELIRWAQRTGGLVIEDDYDGEFRFDRRQVGAVQPLATERVIYVGTASKSLGPGLRLGWLVLPRALVEPVRSALYADGARPAALDQLILADLLDSGAYDQHVRRRRAAYRSRRDRLLVRLPGWLRPMGISAGLHLLLRLPDGRPDERTVLAALRRHSVALEGLGRHWIGDGPHPGGLVVGYGAPPEHAFNATVDALVEALDDVRPA